MLGLLPYSSNQVLGLRAFRPEPFDVFCQFGPLPWLLLLFRADEVAAGKSCGDPARGKCRDWGGGGLKACGFIGFRDDILLTK